MLYIAKGKIKGRWKNLNTGGVSRPDAIRNAVVQSIMRGCETKVVEWHPKAKSKK